MMGLRMPVVGLALLAASEALAGPAIASRYTEPARIKDTQLTQENCLTRAENVLKAMDFTDIERTEQSRYGTFREYTGVIRCIVDKQIVMFIVSGPARETANRGSAALFERFEAVQQ